jgi:hypothetical protein
MAEKKGDLVQMVTPKAPAMWAKLNKADYKFNKEGTFTIKQKLTADMAAAHIEHIDAIMEKAFAEAEIEYASKTEAKTAKSGLKKKASAKPLEVQQHLPYAETEDGDFIFSFKLDQVKKDKDTGKETKRKVALFDSKRTPITKNIEIGNGSIVRVSYVAGSNFVAAPNPVVYVTLYILGVQLLTLEAFGARSGNEFDIEEDAFDVDAFVVSESEDDDADESESDDSDEEGAASEDGAEDSDDF